MGKRELSSQDFENYIVYGDYDLIVAEGINHKLFSKHASNELTSHSALAVCKSGTATMKWKESTMAIRKNDVILFYPGPSVRLQDISPDFDIQLIVFASSLVQGRFFRKALPLSDVFTFISENPILSLSDDEVVFFQKMWSILFDAINAKDNQFKKEITVSLLSALAMWLNGQISSHVKSKPIALKRADELVSQFLHLLAENFKEKHRLEFYADKLCVTPKYLSAVTRAATNKSAGKLIAFFLMGEAKKMLIASEMTIAQVATELGSPNQSGFGKFFKKEEGLSPSEFRQRI